MNSSRKTATNWLSAIGYRLSAIGYRLSAIGYRLSAISYRLILGLLLSLAGSITSVANAQLIDGRFQIMDDGQTVKDVKNNLVWTRCSAGQELKNDTCTKNAVPMLL